MPLVNVFAWLLFRVAVYYGYYKYNWCFVFRKLISTYIIIVSY